MSRAFPTTIEMLTLQHQQQLPAPNLPVSSGPASPAVTSTAGANPFKAEHLERMKGYYQRIQQSQSPIKKEVQLFIIILQHVPLVQGANEAGLTFQEKQVILDYLQKLESGQHGTERAQQGQSNSCQMVRMIFRFFLQSGEYQFFIKRLKNVAHSKLGGSMNFSKANPLLSQPASLVNSIDFGQSPYCSHGMEASPERKPRVSTKIEKVPQINSGIGHQIIVSPSKQIQTQSKRPATSSAPAVKSHRGHQRRQPQQAATHLQILKQQQPSSEQRQSQKQPHQQPLHRISQLLSEAQQCEANLLSKAQLNESAFDLETFAAQKSFASQKSKHRNNRREPARMPTQGDIPREKAASFIQPRILINSNSSINPGSQPTSGLPRQGSDADLLSSRSTQLSGPTTSKTIPEKKGGHTRTRNQQETLSSALLSSFRAKKEQYKNLLVQDLNRHSFQVNPSGTKIEGTHQTKRHSFDESCKQSPAHKRTHSSVAQVQRAMANGAKSARPALQPAKQQSSENHASIVPKVLVVTNKDSRAITSQRHLPTEEPLPQKSQPLIQGSYSNPSIVRAPKSSQMAQGQLTEQPTTHLNTDSSALSLLQTGYNPNTFKPGDKVSSALSPPRPTLVLQQAPSPVTAQSSKPSGSKAGLNMLQAQQEVFKLRPQKCFTSSNLSYPSATPSLRIIRQQGVTKTKDHAYRLIEEAAGLPHLSLDANPPVKKQEKVPTIQESYQYFTKQQQAAFGQPIVAKTTTQVIRSSNPIEARSISVQPTQGIPIPTWLCPSKLPITAGYQ